MHRQMSTPVQSGVCSNRAMPQPPTPFDTGSNIRKTYGWLDKLVFVREFNIRGHTYVSGYRNIYRYMPTKWRAVGYRGIQGPVLFRARLPLAASPS